MELILQNLCDNLARLWHCQTLRLAPHVPVTSLLASLAAHPPEDLLLAGQGAQTTEHAVWRLVMSDVPLLEVDRMLRAVRSLLLPWMRLRATPALVDGLAYGMALEALQDGTWMPIGSCGLVAPILLIDQGFDCVRANALALHLNEPAVAAFARRARETKSRMQP